MRTSRAEFLVYLVGVAILGLSQAYVRAAVGSDVLSFLLAIAYLLVLRAIGWGLSRVLAKRQQRQ